MEKRQQAYPWGTPSSSPPLWPPCPFVSHGHVLLPPPPKEQKTFQKSIQGQPSRHIVGYISRTFTHLRPLSGSRTVHVRHYRPAYGPAHSRSPPYAPYSALARSSAFKYHTPISRFSTYPILTLQPTMSGLKITEFSVHGMSCTVLLLTTG